MDVGTWRPGSITGWAYLLNEFEYGPSRWSRSRRRRRTSRATPSAPASSARPSSRARSMRRLLLWRRLLLLCGCRSFAVQAAATGLSRDEVMRDVILASQPSKRLIDTGLPPCPAGRCAPARATTVHPLRQRSRGGVCKLITMNRHRRRRRARCLPRERARGEHHGRGAQHRWRMGRALSIAQ